MAESNMWLRVAMQSGMRTGGSGMEISARRSSPWLLSPTRCIRAACAGGGEDHNNSKVWFHGAKLLFPVRGLS